MSQPHHHAFVILGAGVIGLTTALSLRTAYPSAHITILAKHLPGDRAAEYASPWAGANWFSVGTTGDPMQAYEEITFHKLDELMRKHPEAGIARLPIRSIFDSEMGESGIFDSVDGEKGELWYSHLVGPIHSLPACQLPAGATFGLDIPSTFILNTQTYLPWLLHRCLSLNIHFIRRGYPSLARLSADFPRASVIINCSGLGALTLADVRDTSVYPVRGQTVLLAEPRTPLQRMYFRSPRRVDPTTTYVFPRPLGGGIILGGSRQADDWNTDVDYELAEDIMRRCCKLCPELGPREGLEVVGHGVGFRPGRKGGVRVEVERRREDWWCPVVHCYGAGGAGYQGSWGMGGRVVELVRGVLEGRARL
ncbi:hypothetical protein LTS18_002813 [Coniosporium uncinatum]|uniref:Uncharacterized protein n=1 Tax=Coniosporium uncinatum TaxID=93489 RepID=A0ACC3DU00_9PEZI|nr:hypothetical protein LTS18_002813 [Coniosporium uncinatum]